MHEYKRDSQAQTFIGGGIVRIKNSKGQIYTSDYISKWSQSGGLSLSHNLIPFLKKSIGVVKVVVYDDYSSVYQFTLNANGFTAAYNEIKN